MLNLNKKSGFTLVELLIVVAIIGILATIGIPTYQKMIGKAKKSEAKVALGGVRTSEIAFNSEYASYGDNLAKMGFDVGPNQYSPTAIYTVGFPTDGACAPAAGPRPSNGDNAATFARITSMYPAYYTAGTYMATMGRNPAASAPAAVCDFSANLGTGGSPADGTTFVARATGSIISKTLPSSPVAGCGVGGIVCQDVWTIDQDGVLANTVDGMN